MIAVTSTPASRFYQSLTLSTRNSFRAVPCTSLSVLAKPNCAGNSLLLLLGELVPFGRHGPFPFVLAKPSSGYLMNSWRLKWTDSWWAQS